MAFPTDIDAIPTFQAGDTLNAAQHHALHTNILDRVYQIQNFLGPSPGAEAGGTMRLRLKTAEATIVTLTGAITDAQVPPGTIVAYGGASAPPGWKICNGGAHGSAALKAVLATVVGSPAGPGPSDYTPDLRDKFILGKGGTLPATGGVQQVTLSAAQSGLPAHNHGAGASTTWTDHLHSFTTGWMNQNNVHGHSAWTGGGGDHGHNHYASNMLSAEGDFNPAGTGHPYLIGYGATIGADASAHNHPLGVSDVDINHQHSGNTDGVRPEYPAAANHTHTITISNNAAAGATLPVNIMNPYYALVYIIRAP